MLLVVSFAARAEAQVRLEGRVTLPDGAPVAGATVRVRGLDLQPASTTTDPAGRYVFPDLKGTWVVVSVWADGRPIAEGAALITLATEVMNLTARTGVTTPTSAADLNPMEGAGGTVGGTVRGPDGRPLVGARVAVRDTPLATTTDSFGRFDLGRIRAGLRLTLDASAAGYAGTSGTVEVAPDRLTTTDFQLSGVAAPSARTELAPLAAPAGPDAVLLPSSAITGVTAPRIADTVRAVQLLPDVRGSLEDPTGFVMRGGSADQTAFTYEGMTLYPFSGLRGMFGGFDAAAVASASVSKDALGFPGAGLASAVHLEGLSGAYPGRPTGYFDANAFGVGGRLVVPIARRAAILVAARQNPPDKLYQNVLDKYSSGQGLFVPSRVPSYAGGTLAPSPTVGFHDINATIDVRPTNSDRVSVSYYDARDAANLSRNLDVAGSAALNVPNPDKVPDAAVAEISDVYEWTGEGASATWRRQWSRRVTSTLSLGRTEFSKFDARASRLLGANTGEDFTFLDGRNGSDALTNNNRIQHTSVRFESTIDLGFRHGLTVGGEAADLEATYAGRVERQVAPRQVALVASGDQDTSGQLLRLYVEDLWRPTSKLLLTLGARLVRFDADDAAKVEPLVSATYSWMPGIRVVGSWSVSHQAATRITREDRLHGDRSFWALANGSTIRMPRVEQWSGGARFDAIPGVVLEASMFYKRFDDLTMLAPIHTPVYVESSLDAVLHNGDGKAAGVNLMLQSQTRWNDIWVSYAGGRTVHRFPTLGAGTFVPSFDRTHEFKVGDTWRVSGPWSVGATWVAASGLPTTSVSRKVVWVGTSSQVYRTEYGNKNTGRLAGYHRLDVSTDVTWRLPGASVTIGAAVFNAYDQDNVWYRTYEIAGSNVDTENMRFIRRAFNAFLRVGF